MQIFLVSQTAFDLTCHTLCGVFFLKFIMHVCLLENVRFTCPMIFIHTIDVCGLCCFFTFLI